MSSWSALNSALQQRALSLLPLVLETSAALSRSTPMNRADYTLSSPATSLGAIAMLAAGLVIALLVHWLFFWFAQRVVRRTRREADDAILAALYQPSPWLLALLGFGAVLAPILFGPPPRAFLTFGGG